MLESELDIVTSGTCKPPARACVSGTSNTGTEKSWNRKFDGDDGHAFPSNVKGKPSRGVSLHRCLLARCHERYLL
jgi:hypothetical protein